jgi:choline dehydrogenase-like flavoprotein
MEMKPVFDVCIVGSGPGGGIATYVLAKAGLKVALVEAGPILRAGIDYGTHAWPHEVREQRIKGGLLSLMPSLFVDRRERNHFTPVGDNPDHGLLKALGGRSLCWAGHSLRFGPLDFKQWPISYDEVAPYYGKAERFMGVYGYKDGLYNLPDGEFLKPVPMRCPEMLLKRGVERLKARGRNMEFIAQRKAMVTQDHSSRRAHCHFCGQCGNCCVDAKYTSANTPIPLAMKTGNLTLYTESMMTRILLDESTQRVTGIEYSTAKGTVERVQAKALVLACSAVETARQLLLNKTREFPTGLGNHSSQVGRNLTSHFGVTVMGYFPELRNRDASNDDGTGYYHSLLTGLYWDRPHPNFEGTYQVQCGAGMQPWRLAGRVVDGFGSAFKREIKEKSIGHAGMNMQGTTLISPKKFVDLDPERKDRYGLSLPRVHLHYEPNDFAMAQNMVETCEEIIRAGGGEILSTPGPITAEKLQIDYNHWVGTTRMGRDAKTSVVNMSSQCHDVPNLFIGDASVFPAYPEKNPTLTNIALSWRMSDHLVEKFRKGELG